MTLVIVLEPDGSVIRVADISRVAGTPDSIVPLDERDDPMARFKTEDVRSWSAE
jgi:hypothetical protein